MKGVVVTIAAAAIGTAIPLPKTIAPSKPQGSAQENKDTLQEAKEAGE